MSYHLKSLALIAGTGVLGFGAVMAVSEPAAAGGSGLSCEIHQSHRGGSVVLEGVVYSGSATDGSYQFTVTKSGGGGSSNINQGGEFSVSAGGRSSVGTVELGGDGGYSATLRVSADGHSSSCKERIGGAL